MEPSQNTWLLIVNHDFRAIGRRFTVITTSGDSVETLKEKAIKKQMPTSRINPGHCTMWRTKGKLIINKSTAKKLALTLRNIDVEDEDTIEDLIEDLTVADLQLSNGETLLLQLPGPGTSRNSISATVRCVLI